MKYDKTIARIRSREMSRDALVKLRQNAERLLKDGDLEAKKVLEELDSGEPSDERYIFMGFCPGATIENRLDIDWKEKGICTFVFFESEHQLQKFNDIFPGDLIILKKRQEFGRSMRLYGHGRAKSWAFDDDENRYLEMDWSQQDEIIEVPLMGCNSTVDVKVRDTVESYMPQEFWAWLKG